MEKINVFIKSLVVCVAVGLGACTNYQYIDTGLANGKHDCTVWEYLHSQPDDWDSTILLIENAGMKAYFDGSMPNQQITFFGVTNLSILRMMLDHNVEIEEDGELWNKVSDIPEEVCQYILNQLIVPQRLTVNDVPKGNLEETTGKEIDGKVYSTLEICFLILSGKIIIKYRRKGNLGFTFICITRKIVRKIGLFPRIFK